MEHKYLIGMIFSIFLISTSVSALITQKYYNTFSGTLSAQLNNGDATVSIVSSNTNTNSLPEVGAQFEITIYSGTTPATSSAVERLLVSRSSGNIYTIIRRAMESTVTPSYWQSNTKVTHVITAGMFTEVADELNSKVTVSALDLKQNSISSGCNPLAISDIHSDGTVSCIATNITATVGQGFDLVQSGVNSSATLTVDSGASLQPHGSGVIGATTMPWSGLTGASPVPTALSQLSDDATHRVVTDTEKNLWAVGSSSLTTVGTITSGTWHGSTIIPSYGGTGLTDFSLSGTSHKVGSVGFVTPASNKCLEVDTLGNIQIAGTNTTCGSGGGMTWPSAAGIALYNGDSTWGAVLNAGNPIPANFVSILNQNTTGVAGGLSAQYIDWNAVSGGTSIANKPNLAVLYQPLSTNLTTFAGVSPSANAQTLLGHSFGQILVDLNLNNVTNDAQTKASVVPNTVPTAGQLLVGNSGGTAFTTVTLGGDCTLAATGSATCTKTNGSTFGSLFQPLNTNLTTYASIAPSANAQTLLSHSFSQMITDIGAQPLLTNPITGTGTQYYLPYWTGAGTQGALASTGTAGYVLTSNGASAAPSFQVLAGGGNVSTNGTPGLHQFGVWYDTSHIKGVAVTGSKVVCTDSSGEPVACANITDTQLGTMASLNNPLTTVGDLWVGTTSGAPNRLADVAVGQPLLSGGIGVSPAYSGYTFTGTAGMLYTFPTTTKTLMASDYSNAGSTPTWNQDTTGMAGSLKSPATTGKTTITGPAAASTRAKTVRDADDTILELGGSYTPSGTWNWGTASVTWPTLNQNTSGTSANVSGTPALPNGTTTTTQTAGDNSTKLASTAYADALVSNASYSATTWGGVTNVSPSKKVVSDYLESKLPSGSDGSYRLSLLNNTAISPTASVDEIYFETNIIKFNQNGTEYSAAIGPTGAQVSFTGLSTARTYTMPDAATTLCGTNSVCTGYQASLTNPITGTGTQYYIPYWTAAGTQGALASVGSSGNPLISNGAGAAPSFLPMVLSGGTNTFGISNGTAVLTVGAGKTLNFTGTYTDGYLCSFTSAGSIVGCNVAPAGTGDLVHSGSPTIHQWGVFTDGTHIKGVTVTGSKVSCTDANGEPVACTNLTDVVPLVSGGALGTPSSATLTNATGLPIAGLVSSTSTTLGVGAIELGHASDTTIARSGAGVITVEGVTITRTIASGTSAMGTGAIASGACATVVTTTATNTATTDVINWGFNGDPTGVTGYVPSVNGMLTIIAYPSTNNVNYKVCNNTAASITPGAITLNWNVHR